MNNINKYFILLIFMICSFNSAQNLVQKDYIKSDEIISNPERGFSVYRSSPVTGAFINSVKQYKVSVVQRIYTIPQFNNSPLSDDFLFSVKSDLNAAREGGVKLVQRFSYTDNQNGADAPLNIIQTHINQLKPIWEENYDVIVYIEAGFIGAWGEWYYSSNGLNNTEDRRTVLFSILDALPKDRAVVVRTPQYKRLIFDDNTPIASNEAFNKSNKSRTGAHNDCFLASSTDFGTYVDNNIEGDKNYLNQDNMYVPQGGETCNPSQFSDCNIAPIDLERMHWSILNRDYHPTVLSGWKSEGCFDEIARRLGYNFTLINGEYTKDVKPGGQISIKLKIYNDGYANPFNPRNLEFILRNTVTKAKYRLVTNEDPRFWFSGDSISVDVSAGIVNEMPEGNYELLVHLADPEVLLHDRPEYSIRFSNESLWEDSTGYNSLDHVLEINSNVEGENYIGDYLFLPLSGGNTNSSLIEIDGGFDDWTSVDQFDVDDYAEPIGDALNKQTDIKDIWLTDDEENLYISYSLDTAFSSTYFYHVFFDLDLDTSTGFHSTNSYAGIDLMIENDQIWKYTGQNGEWSWAPFGSFSSAIGSTDMSRIEISISKENLKFLGAKNSIDFILNVNNLNNEIDDDYAPDLYEEISYNYNYLVTSIHADKITKVPNEIEIQAYPNPFNGQVNILFKSTSMSIQSGGIYDILGRKIKNYSPKELETNKIMWNGTTEAGSSVGSGIYFFQLSTAAGLFSKKIILLQ